MKLTKNIFLYPERGMLSCNTYFIKDDVNVIIDTGGEADLPALIKDLAKDDIRPEDIHIITNTHLHLDHWGANQPLKEISKARIALHNLHKQYLEMNLIEMPKLFGSLFNFALKPKVFREDSLLDSKLITGNMEFELLHAPGHSPDSICFYSKAEKILICGDVVFDQSTGRVDFPGGSAEEIKRSIENLSHLDIEYLLPGHMNIVKGKEVVERNFDFVRKYVFPWL